MTSFSANRWTESPEFLKKIVAAENVLLCLWVSKSEVGRLPIFKKKKNGKIIKRHRFTLKK